MFEEAESDPQLSQEEFKKIEQHLRVQLVNEQYRHIALKDRALLILVAGIDGAGKGETINLLNEWMDPRHIHTIAFPEASREDRAYPDARRFWMRLPAKGEIGIVFGSRYTSLFKEVARKQPDLEKLEQEIHFVRRFESTLAANGVQILKLWFHLSRDAQQARIDELLANPSTAWQVDKLDLRAHKKFASIRRASQLILDGTDAPHTPWVVIPSADPKLRMVHTAQAVLESLKVGTIKVPVFHAPDRVPTRAAKVPRLEHLDYSAKLSKSDYETQVLILQNRLAQLVRNKTFKKQALALVFEGSDAAGKGGAIRRVTRAIDARQFDVMPVAAPTPPEMSRPYLWRFWRNVPRRGRIAIFDRSWYGRVLVERVEKLITRAAWTRAYDEINDFEQQMVEKGTIVLKFWLAVTPAEQLKRFKERSHSPFKQFKITAEDWRNRRKAKAYAVAANEMFAHTHTAVAPWHVLPADDKHFARVEVLKAIVQALEDTQA
ncbi:MAG: polyphosphate:AMP phosphotransferase [Zwartia sp.]|jgi:polyphosphate:AMP phosphotransferase